MANIVLVTLGLLAALPADGTRIIVRHDRPDSRYLALGAQHPAVVRVGRRMGDGTLVGDRWVLTAAHVARGLMNGIGRGPRAVFVGDREYRVARAFLHPDWAEMSPEDIALLELEEPVREGTPVPLYDGTSESGRVAVLVGHGRTGTGSSRERHDDDRKRGATNRVESVTAGQLIFRFDAPPDGTDLEGIPGAGDSGGPALIEVDGQHYVAGVSSAGEPGRDGPGTYGALDYFTRVSAHVAWLRAVMAGRAEPAGAAGAHARPVADSVIPDSPAGRRLRALLELLRSREEARIAAFVRDHVRRDPAAPPDDAAAIARYRRLMAEHEDLTVVRVLLREPHHVDLLVRTRSGERILGVQVEAVADGRIIGVLTGRP